MNSTKLHTTCCRIASELRGEAKLWPADGLRAKVLREAAVRLGMTARFAYEADRQREVALLLEAGVNVLVAAMLSRADQAIQEGELWR